LIINDDLGALSDWAGEMGAAAAETEAQLFVALLLSNPVLNDGTALFHANHGNLAASGGAIDTTTLSAGRLAMRSQTGLGGVRPVAVSPTAIVVSPAGETAAEQVTIALTPNATTAVNPFAGQLRVEVEPRLSGNAWYLFSQSAAFQHAYLNGQRGPQVSSREGFDILGIEFRAVLDFGVGVRDHRFVYKNAGAGG
jgi:phage major head subunit gpT-like protein